MISVGIVGFGSFGQFLAEQLDSYCKVRVFSKSGKTNQWQAPLKEVAASDLVIPAIPLEAYESVLTEVKPLLRPDSVIVDVASVKLKPVALIKKLLPDQPLVSTHPLFGPESAAGGLAGHTLVLCPEHSDKDAADAVRSLAKTLDLQVVEMGEDEHDREMALVHALTFFIAHSLKDMKLHDQKLSTPSFKKLLALAELEKHHSDQLFRTIQDGNLYAKAVRQDFLKHALSLDKSL